VRKLTLLQKLSGAVDEKKIKLYIMTNTFNKNDIKGHFKSKNYFEYGSSNIFFFSQPVEPFVDQHGKIVLKNQFNIYMSSRGTGLLY
jgi:UDP-N-acetylglucosamine pyrophosphorylase